MSFSLFYRKNESNRKKSIAAEVLGGAINPQQQFTGGMTANQTSFDDSQIRNQVAYAFKNRSIVTSVPPQFQQQNAMMGMQQQNAMMGMQQQNAMMGMQPMMYGGMGCMPGMGMGMQGMNFGATNFSLEDDDGEERKRKKKKSKSS